MQSDPRMDGPSKPDPEFRYNVFCSAYPVNATLCLLSEHSTGVSVGALSRLTILNRAFVEGPSGAGEVRYTCRLNRRGCDIVDAVVTIGHGEVAPFPALPQPYSDGPPMRRQATIRGEDQVMASAPPADGNQCQTPASTAGCFQTPSELVLDRAAYNCLQGDLSRAFEAIDAMQAALRQAGHHLGKAAFAR